MLKISDDTIEQIANGIVDLIKQGGLLKRDAEGGDGWQDEENLEIFWYDYIKRVDQHEKKYIVIINSMLTRQAKEVFDKIKKYPNSYKKWMFDRKKWLREFADAEAKFIVKLYKQEGQKAIDLALKLSRKSYYKAEEIPISIAFDVYNPEVTSELLKQTRRFPAGVVGTSEEIIRREIANGLELGESIDKLRKRVTERLGPTYIKNRAEMIARSETIYASNAGAELGYMQSGVVEGKKWLTALDERTCFPCTDMNNMTAPLGQPTWEKEGLNIGEVQGKYGLDFDYTEGAMPHPPLHPRCRCTIIPIVKMVERFKPASTIKEAEEWAKKYGVNYRTDITSISLKTMNDVNLQVAKIPKKYLLKGKSKGLKIEVVADSGIIVHPRYANLKGVKPRGWPEGTSWDTVPGCAAPKIKETLIVGNNLRTGHGSINLVLHEHAHNLEANIFNYISSEMDFIRIHSANKKAGLIKSAYGSMYPVEYWAESFARYYQYPSSLPKNVIEYFKKLEVAFK